MQRIPEGINIEALLKGNGTVFDIELCPSNVPLDCDDTDQAKQYEEAVKPFLKEFENKECSAGEPFDQLATKMTNLLSDGTIKKHIIKEGYSVKPDPSSIVQINYNAYIEDDAIPFDSTYSRNKPLLFTMGEGEVIPGLELSVQSMQINERAEFLIQPELAYKDSGLGRIPANSIVLFDINLIAIMETNSQANDEETKSFEQIYKFCKDCYTRGKNAFKRDDVSSATKYFKQGIDKLEKCIMNDYNDQEKSDSLLIQLYANLLICYAEQKLPKKGCTCANEIFRIYKNRTDKPRAKVYFHQARCLRMLGDYDRALTQLYRASDLEPEDNAIIEEFKCLNICINNSKKSNDNLNVK